MTQEQLNEDRNKQRDRMFKAFWGVLTSEVSVHHTAFLGAIASTIYLYHRRTGDDLDEIVSDVLKRIENMKGDPSEPEPFEKPSRN